jgi:hypothetical protein
VHLVENDFEEGGGGLEGAQSLYVDEVDGTFGQLVEVLEAFGVA